MTEDAAAWSEHDLDRRFGLGEPYDELTRLAATLDSLLERIAASLRHEQRFTAELSHELRTPLARISGEAELMLRRERTPDEYRAALAAIQRSVDQMTRTVRRLSRPHARRRGSSTTQRRREPSRQSSRTPRETAPTSTFGVTLPAEPARVAADEELVERMVQPLLDNAVRYGRSAVDVSLVRNGSFAFVHVADDGRRRRARAGDDLRARARGEAARPTARAAPASALRSRGGSPAARGVTLPSFRVRQARRCRAPAPAVLPAATSPATSR